MAFHSCTPLGPFTSKADCYVRVCPVTTLKQIQTNPGGPGEWKTGPVCGRHGAVVHAAGEALLQLGVLGKHLKRQILVEFSDSKFKFSALCY